MKNKDVNKAIRQAFTHAAPNVLDSVLSECGTQKGTVIVMTEKKKVHWGIKLAAAAAMLALIIGIGFGDERQLKIEAYRETETGVESICAYERAAYFSTDYKSYYIDRENQLIGLGYTWGGDMYTDTWYVLLHFDGNAFHELAMVPLIGNNVPVEEIRGVVVDGWLYVFTSSFYLQKVW